ncbi:YkvI family membrane protein [Kordiimonas pumila]|uniref:Membrane protein YkvI n=1 Tax=Kordiimonas pumila TaxID=2161677 RepID=A0ABV7D3A8_9PROT|nr:hypothetical protein [Kordiimonas pumila]
MSFFSKYILPGFIFQSVVIGGGYATGRELVEFFFSAGPVGGVLGLLMAGLVFGVVLAAGFEFARVTGAYDYRHFCRELLGRGWVLFEVAYFILMLLILSVIGSAAGALLSDMFGVTPLVGTLFLMGFIGVLTFTGSSIIAQVLSWWSVLLYAVYITMFVLAYKNFGADIAHTFETAPNTNGWISGGVLYAGYNLATLPAVLFAIKALNTRRETVGAGLIAGAIAVVPAILFFTAMMGRFPEIGSEPVPSTYLMAQIHSGWLAVVFQVVIFGTFVETGTALLHSVNERLEGSFEDKGKTLPRMARPLVAIGFLAIAIFAAETFGIVNLIAQGYGLLTLVFIAILVVPILTIGVYKSVKKGAV